jgi:glycosyltransferase involved in cell wall biosynthesis
MRLLYLSCDPGIPVLGHKGASVHVRELAGALSLLGTEVVVASPRIEPAGDSLVTPLRLLQLPRLTLEAPEPELRVALEAQRAAVLEAARSVAADAIYERYALFGDAGVRAAAALQIPHVLELNAPLREEASRFRTLPHPDLAAEIERSVFRRTGRILAVSSALGRWLEREGVEGERIEVVPNAIAPHRFSAPRRERHDDEFVLGFCGSLKPWHGIEVLLEACAMAFSEEPALRLEVVGSGPLEHLLQADLPDARVRALGPLRHDETIERLRSWNVGVAPYLPLPDFYFSPLKVVEYMAAGLCAVVSEVGDLPALLDRGRRGILVPAGDAEHLASVFVELARDPERAVELGRRAREHVLEAHTWERNAHVVLDAFHASRELAA